jgi:hypothetical protein
VLRVFWRTFSIVGLFFILTKPQLLKVNFISIVTVGSLGRPGLCTQCLVGSRYDFVSSTEETNVLHLTKTFLYEQLTQSVKFK